MRTGADRPSRMSLLDEEQVTAGGWEPPPSEGLFESRQEGSERSHALWVEDVDPGSLPSRQSWAPAGPSLGADAAGGGQQPPVPAPPPPPAR